ncbi:RNA ligase-domain-containing protein [Suillus clintonianus]|uniref:RNA ligase-domain-containing protein n=1 Tax=Suillus clintonianus TaxID=1904413 RepID=UPI001B8613D2|nr:RNA ligase-domain-containing protein [Suillus clintonianus]KAG2143593.1 RNA ligase-domain-containing protein [Suillus clintonianus]
MSTHLRSEDSQLISDLHRLSKKSPKLVRSTVYNAPSDPSISIRSWKMNEFKYYDVPSPFPTLARGLFSRELPCGDDPEGEPKYQIVARGYDKFFNIGEVPWTDWSTLSLHTGPTYTLSLKSNGCIIFIAPISPSKLIVTSKHALGPMQGVPETHSEVGHRWLKKHLVEKGKTEEQLASKLWEKNWTTIAELCDDSFEEHVLPYPAEKSGLHLHGINETLREFHTMPTETVNAFAEEWGFIKTPTITLNSIAEVKSFTDDIAKTGEWNGEALEGFVVRTHIVDSKKGSTTRNSRPPYPTGSSFFFKVKFDEPYMMYRDWREVTKILLSTKGSLNDAKLPKSKMKRKETHLYVDWVKKEIRHNPSAFLEYSQGKGIIATRERFLKWMETDDGKNGLVVEDEAPLTTKEFGKTIIVPVAIPGCGKTAVSVALTSLFNIGHTQSDDIQAKKSAPVFIRNVINLLKDHDIVIADKNNHLRQHRDSLREAVAKMNPPVRLLALNWSLDRPQATIHRICGDRVFARGDKHQTLRADTLAKAHEYVIWQFIRNSEELADEEVDVSIEMDLEDTLEQAVDRAVTACVSILGLRQPSAEEIDEAVHKARNYVPQTQKPQEKKKKKDEPSTPRYFGLLPEVNLIDVIGKQMEGASDVPENGKAFWNALVADHRVTLRPHITVVHNKSLPDAIELWERCSQLHRMALPPWFTFTLGHLVWNKRIMAITVDDFELDIPPDNLSSLGQEGGEFVSKLSEEVRNGLHITVGTSDSEIPPFEAKALVEAWRFGKRSGIGSLELEGLTARGRIKGLFS